MIENQQEYSTLEAVFPRRPLHNNQEPLPAHPEKQVAFDCGKQFVSRSEATEVDCRKQHVLGDGGIGVAGRYEFPTSEKAPVDVRPQARSVRRKWLLLGGAIALVIILAAVIGGVFGSRYFNSRAKQSDDSGNSTHPVTSPTPKPLKYNIAAFSFGSNSSNETRVYYQGNSGQFVEATSSSENSTWIHRSLGFSGKNGSAIAAAVSRPNFNPLQITLLYVDENNILHDIIYDESARSWSAGKLADDQHMLLANSSLSVMYNQCPLCANTTIIAFQDYNGDVQIGNLTSAGWTLTQLEIFPQIPTGLGLQPFYRVGTMDQINLYYQKTDLTMYLASWKPADINGGIYGWSLTEQTYSGIPPSTPIAAASSYAKISTGFEDWIEVLSLSLSSIMVNTWWGNINDWLALDSYPSAMANSSIAANIYESVAVTAIGKAFAVVRPPGQKAYIASWQVSDSLTYWTATGNVEIGNVWD